MSLDDLSHTLADERAEAALNPERRTSLQVRAEESYCAYPEDDR